MCFLSLIFWLCARVFVGLFSFSLVVSHTHLSKNCPRVLCVCLVFFSEKKIFIFWKKNSESSDFRFSQLFFFDSKLHSTKRERERDVWCEGKNFYFFEKTNWNKRCGNIFNIIYFYIHQTTTEKKNFTSSFWFADSPKKGVKTMKTVVDDLNDKPDKPE